MINGTMGDDALSFPSVGVLDSPLFIIFVHY